MTSSGVVARTCFPRPPCDTAERQRGRAGLRCQGLPTLQKDSYELPVNEGLDRELVLSVRGRRMQSHESGDDGPVIGPERCFGDEARGETQDHEQGRDHESDC